MVLFRAHLVFFSLWDFYRVFTGLPPCASLLFPFLGWGLVWFFFIIRSVFPGFFYFLSFFHRGSVAIVRGRSVLFGPMGSSGWNFVGDSHFCREIGFLFSFLFSFWVAADRFRAFFSLRHGCRHRTSFVSHWSGFFLRCRKSLLSEISKRSNCLAVLFVFFCRLLSAVFCFDSGPCRIGASGVPARCRASETPRRHCRLFETKRNETKREREREREKREIFSTGKTDGAAQWGDLVRTGSEQVSLAGIFFGFFFFEVLKRDFLCDRNGFATDCTEFFFYLTIEIKQPTSQTSNGLYWVFAYRVCFFLLAAAHKKEDSACNQFRSISPSCTRFFIFF